MAGHGERLHAKFAASATHRWIACPGSIALSETIPAIEQIASGYGLDGTQAHELFEYALAEGYKSAREAFIMSEFTWIYYYDNYEERLDSVQTAVDYVYGVIADNTDPAKPNVRMYLEQTFRFPSSTGEDVGGTADVILYFPDTLLMYVIDFKHGAGKTVDAPHNPQLKMYLVGGLTRLGQEGFRVGMMVGVIVQPRAYHPDGIIREWIASDEELTSFVGEVDRAIIACSVPQAPRYPGAWCEWCPGSIKCPEFEYASVKRIDKMFTTFQQVATTGTPALPKPTEVPVDRLADVLSWGEVVAGWFTMMKEYATDYARQGYTIPGKKLVYTHARRKWDPSQEPNEIANKLATLTGKTVDQVYPRELINITEADKAIKDALRGMGLGRKAVADANEAMAYLTIKEQSGNVTLVDVTDNRPPVNATELFKTVQLEK